MNRIGWTLVLVGIGLMAGYGLYEAGKALITAEEVSIILKIGIIVLAVGLVLSLIVVIRDRLKEEPLEDDEV